MVWQIFWSLSKQVDWMGQTYEDDQIKLDQFDFYPILSDVMMLIQLDIQSMMKNWMILRRLYITKQVQEYPYREVKMMMR